MTLRVRDWHLDSDLDIIHNSCDVSISFFLQYYHIFCFFLQKEDRRQKSYKGNSVSLKEGSEETKMLQYLTDF